MPAWTRKHLLGLEDLTRDEVVSILDRAETYLETARNPAARKTTLAGRVVVNLFFEPSTRTRLSFELAEKRLSADTMGITLFDAMGQAEQAGLGTAARRAVEAFHTLMLSLMSARLSR